MSLISIFLILSALSVQEGLPPVGVIEIYGGYSIPENEVREKLPVKVGDPIPADIDAFMKALHESLSKLPNIKQVDANLECCALGKTTLFIGLSDRVPQSMNYHPMPTGSIRLPREVIEAEEAYQNFLSEAVLKGAADEDHSAGHTLSKYPPLRKAQDTFVRYASTNLKTLRTVLRDSADSTHRAIAAQILAYTPEKQAVVSELVDAIKDSDSKVRNNAQRALWVMASAVAQKKLNVKIPWAPFLDQLDSIVWTDRNKSSLALDLLTRGRNPRLLGELRKRSLTPLIEIAKWRTGHAYSGLFILGRIDGLSEEIIQAAWDRGDREFILLRAEKLRNTRK